MRPSRFLDRSRAQTISPPALLSTWILKGNPRQGGAFWRLCLPGRRWKWAPLLLAPALVACVSYPPRRVVMGLADTCHIGPFARPGGTDRFLERPIQLTLASACVSAVAVHMLLQRSSIGGGSDIQRLLALSTNQTHQLSYGGCSTLFGVRSDGRREGEKGEGGGSLGLPEDQQRTVLAREYRSCLFS